MTLRALPLPTLPTSTHWLGLGRNYWPDWGGMSKQLQSLRDASCQTWGRTWMIFPCDAQTLPYTTANVFQGPLRSWQGVLRAKAFLH